MPTWLRRHCEASARGGYERPGREPILEVGGELCRRRLHGGCYARLGYVQAKQQLDSLTTGAELLESRMQGQSPRRIEELVKIFIRATEMETGFWDMGLRGSSA